MRTVLLLTHLGLAASWLGAMGYSLLVVQPRAERFFRTQLQDDEAYESFLTVLAARNRWRVVGVIGGIGASGVGLLLLEPHALPVHLAKAVLLVVATAVFWYVSWRIWPRRLFAVDEEVPALRTAVRRSGVALLTLMGSAFVLGVVGRTG